jgi:dihydropteroate synthase
MGRPLVMGVLNVTPDSFSDGGLYLDPDRAAAKGMQLVAEGADVVDVGGESTRPGAEPVPEDEELRRVLPVVERLARSVRVSIDTTKPVVAQAALDAGATLVNDVSAGLWEIAASRSAGWVAMHMRGTPRNMQDDPRYDDVVEEVRDFLLERADTARSAGVKEVWIDPGIGFGKTDEHNLLLLKHLARLVETGFPVLVGTSRKGFLGRLARGTNGEPAPAAERLAGSLATAVWAMLSGAEMVRVHDVAPTVHAVTLVGRTRIDTSATSGIPRTVDGP